MTPTPAFLRGESRAVGSARSKLAILPVVSILADTFISKLKVALIKRIDLLGYTFMVGGLIRP
jgi:hypothetical protein